MRVVCVNFDQRCVRRGSLASPLGSRPAGNALISCANQYIYVKLETKLVGFNRIIIILLYISYDIKTRKLARCPIHR